MRPFVYKSRVMSEWCAVAYHEGKYVHMYFETWRQAFDSAFKNVPKEES